MQEQALAAPGPVTDLLQTMPLERKVAQLFLFGFRGTDFSAEIFGRLRQLDLGGIVIGRDTTPTWRSSRRRGEAGLPRARSGT